MKRTSFKEIMEAYLENPYKARSLINILDEQEGEGESPVSTVEITLHWSKRNGIIFPVFNDPLEYLTTTDIRFIIQSLQRYVEQVDDDETLESNEEYRRFSFIRDYLDNELNSFVPGNEMFKPGYIYLIKSNYGYKIGKTKNPNERVKWFGVKLPFRFEVEMLIKVADMTSAETFFHDMFSDKHINGEWFNLDLDDISWIRRIGNWEVL